MTATDTQPNPIIDPEAPDHFEEFDDESWLASVHPKGMRVRLPLAALTLALAVAIGLWAGAKLEAGQNPTTTAAAFSRAAAGGGGATGATGTGATSGAGTTAGGGVKTRGGLSGTVASVQGSTIQLTTTTGSTVTVTLLPSTTITRTAAAAPTDITAGETITVRGATGTDGNTAAQAVAIVPAATSGG